MGLPPPKERTQLYEWKRLRLDAGVFSRRVGLVAVLWIAADAVCIPTFGPRSAVAIVVVSWGIVCWFAAAAIGLLVRLVNPGVFLAADKIKIRNTLTTRIFKRGDIAAFERCPAAFTLFASRDIDSLWVALRDGRRIQTQVQTAPPRRDPLRRPMPGPRVERRELDLEISRLNRWIATGEVPS